MLRFLYRLAYDLGYTVRDLTARMGSDELGYWMAFYEQYEPHRADDRRAAKLAYFAGNTFGKPIRWPEMAGNFGVEAPGKPQAKTLEALPDVVESIGHAMPEHIRARFIH